MKNTIFILLGALLLSTQLATKASPYFTLAGAMSCSRAEHTATLLQNGKVLVTGGFTDAIYSYSSYTATADLFNPTNGLWRNTGGLNNPRYQHTATLLTNGMVLVAGGDGQWESMDSAELYDPATEMWTNTGTLNTGRKLHTATLLANGKVLVVGGFCSGILSSAELYDPATGTWTYTGSLNAPRSNHTATLLPSGKVLVAGGTYISLGTGGPVAMTSAELYDPNTERWTFTYPMSTNRSSQTATLLPNGKVLIAGGSDWNNSIYTAEMYDPATEMWAMTGPLNPVFTYRNATLLPNGKVLATGLHANYGEFPDQANAELFDPVSQSWADLGDMNVMRGYGFTETLLPSGQVLFTGGDGTNNALSSAELFDLAGQGNVPTPPALGITTYNSQPTVFFPMATGANYVLQMTTDLASGNWVTVSNGIPISGLIITNPPDNAFFRLK